MSKIEVDNIDTVTGTTELTIGGTNATSITLGSGASFSNVSGQNYPMFFAHSTSAQTVTNNTYTKVQFGTEVIDTDSAYDTTNYRFTVPSGKAGKYMFSYNVQGTADAVARLQVLWGSFYKNGSQVDNDFGNIEQYYYTNNLRTMNISCSIILDLDASDYIEIYSKVLVSAGTPSIGYGSGANGCWFQGFRIGA